MAKDEPLLTFVCIMGYGAPQHPITDGNLFNYLGPALDHLRIREDGPIETIFLCGGYTNRTDLSEAMAMEQWIDAHRPQWAPKIERIESTLSLEENIRESAREIPKESRVIIFCEASRELAVRFQAWHHMRSMKREVIGIPFDERSLTLAHRLKQFFVHLPIEMVSMYSERVHELKRRRRQRVIDQARAASKK